MRNINIIFLAQNMAFLETKIHLKYDISSTT